MTKPYFSRLLFVVSAALAAALFSGPVLSAKASPATQFVPKPLSPACELGTLGPVVDRASNNLIPHQYMLLMVFKKGTGAQYFGNASDRQNGCIPDVEVKVARANGKRELVAPGPQITAENCPNDCVYPRKTAAAMETGSDPLDSNPWGIVSATDTTREGGAKDSLIEIWEVAVTDACHARRFYEYHTTPGKDRILANALKRNHMLGEILVGYRDPTHKNGKSLPCP
jgi:hypothetical protein